MSVTGTVVGSSSSASIDGGSQHTCGVTTAGVAYCWGQNTYGQLGDGSNYTSRTTPVLVSNGYTWASLITGFDHTCGVTSVAIPGITPAGAAYCWGNNDDGQLGTGNRADIKEPSEWVSGGYTWASVTAGKAHTCGITPEVLLDPPGEAYCWGSNTYGKLGDGTTTNRLIPTKVGGG